MLMLLLNNYYSLKNVSYDGLKLFGTNLPVVLPVAVVLKKGLNILLFQSVMGFYQIPILIVLK